MVRTGALAGVVMALVCLAAANRTAAPLVAQATPVPAGCQVGTHVTDGTSVWSIEPGTNKVLRDGVHFVGGYSPRLLFQEGVIYADNTSWPGQGWWRAIAGGWEPTSPQTCATPVVPCHSGTHVTDGITVWSIEPGTNKVLRDGVHFVGGYSPRLLFKEGVVYADNTSWPGQGWWRATASGWAPASPQTCAGAPAPDGQCAVYSGVPLVVSGEQWWIGAEQKVLRNGQHVAEGYADRLLVKNGVIYVDNTRVGDYWYVFDGVDWQYTSAQSCAADPGGGEGTGGPLSATFAYWNMYSGAGKTSVTGACYDRYGHGVPEPAGYGRGQQGPPMWAFAGPGRPGHDALTAEIAGDPNVVALGVGEAIPSYTLLDILGWEGFDAGRPQVTTEGVFGDYIVAKYGFVESENLHVGGELYNGTLTPYVMNYAKVCLDGGCTRTMPFFSTHYQAAQPHAGGNYDAGIQQMLAFMDQKAGATGPRVFAGDLNAWDPLTDPHLAQCIGAFEPGVKHVEGFRRIRDLAGYTDAWRVIHPAGRAFTGTINRGDPHYRTCLAAAGLPWGYSYKRMDYIFTRGISTISSAAYIGAPFGSGGAGTVGWGNCVGSDHLGVKVGIRVP